MAVNFLNFKESTSVANTDYIVGFNNSQKDGERRWSISTLMSKFAPDLKTTAKAWAVIKNTAAAGSGNGPYILQAGYNVNSVITSPSPGTGSNVGSLRVSFSSPITGIKCVLLSTTYGNAYIGRKITSVEDSDVLTNQSYVDIGWVDYASAINDFLCVAVFAS